MKRYHDVSLYRLVFNDCKFLIHVSEVVVSKSRARKFIFSLDKEKFKSKLEGYGDLYSEDALEQAGKTLGRLGAGAIVAEAWQTFPRPETLYVDFVKPAMPALQDNPEYGKIPYRAQVNIEVILDASGSMKETIGGKTKLALAKEAVETLVRSLPKEANVALRAFGHRPQPTKEASCRFSELLYPFGSYAADRFAAALGEIEASGWTPLAYSIERAGEDFRPYQGEGYTNIVVIVSDGAETCGGDPLKAAEALKGSAIQPYFHIIGFDVDAEGKKQLSALAERVGGSIAMRAIWRRSRPSLTGSRAGAKVGRRGGRRRCAIWGSSA